MGAAARQPPLQPSLKASSFMPDLFPHQLAGAQFLASRRAALLADEQRVGKTPTSIRACDYIMARRILVVTTASARGQWAREFYEWGFPRDIQVIYRGTDRIRDEAEAVVVGWGMVDALFDKLCAISWDVLLIDECHNAKNPAALRTTALYGGSTAGLVECAKRVWCLSGTPAANSPADLWPMLNALAPERLDGIKDYDAFVARYCVTKLKRIGGIMRPVIKGGKNLEELSARIEGFWLRRTQADVGIREPIYSVFALSVDKLPAELMNEAGAQEVFDAIETGETKTLEMHLGPLRRLTGAIKAHAVIQAVSEMLEDRQLDKIVLAAWHTDVVDLLWTGLAKYGVCGVDGRTSAIQRDKEVAKFKQANFRVFVGQIIAAGEALDLSSAAELWFVEPSFTPKDMAQMSKRITHHHQKRQPLVRVCALAGSLDEAFMSILARKVASIRELMDVAK